MVCLSEIVLFNECHHISKARKLKQFIQEIVKQE